MTQELRRHVPDAGAEALAILDPARGPIETPIRSEIFGAARFEQHGHSLAEAHEAQLGASSGAFFPRLRENITVLREAHRYIGLQQRAVDIDPAGEWLLDNFHVVVAQIKEIHDGLPRRYFRDLPVLVDAHLAGLPRIYGVAWAFVAHTDGAFDETLLLHFLDAYQCKRVLTFGELWALPTTLRVVLIENLRRLSEGVAATMAAREIANLWCDRLENDIDPDPQGLLDIMRVRGVERAFVLQVMARLRSDLGADLNEDGPDLTAIRAALELALPEPAAAQMQQQAEQAEANLSLSNTITSLRVLGDIVWRALIARTSTLMHEMQASCVFQTESDATQDATLHAIERLARRSGRPELDVARALLESIRTPPNVDSPVSREDLESPAYWLHDQGRATLCRALGVRTSLLPNWKRWRRRALPAYLAVVAFGTLALTYWFVAKFPPAMHVWPAMTALFALLPASEAVIAIVNRLISESVPPRRLPRLSLAAGVPPQHRVLVVIPSMLTSHAEIETLACRLEHHFLANSEPHAQFALLTDYVDADAALGIDDTHLLDAAIAAVDTLESRYPPAADMPRRFLLLHRNRRWSESEQRWIGWERKRGKLIELIEWLAVGEAFPFVDLGLRSRPIDGTPYVVTLDSDTELPPGVLRELVAVAAHPANRPRVDPARHRVVSGYGVLQPRIVTPLPLRTVTAFHWLFAGQCGVDPYSAVTSEVYQDLFDEGTFTGKGLLDVQAFHAVLNDRLPEGQVLSHDLVEGSIARCGGISDIAVIEDAPMHADVAAARVHRWTRGDWQLLPVLFGGRQFGLRTIDRWKLFDNLRRSLVAPFTVALLVCSFFGGAVPTLAALALAAVAFGGGPLLGALASLAPSRDDLALRHFYRQGFADIGRAIGGTLWSVAQLLQQALLLLDAIVRALYRSLVSHRRLLQWTTAAAAQAAAHRDLAGIARHHKGVPLAAAALLGATLLVDAPDRLLTIVLCSVWAASPLWTWWVSRARRDRHYDVVADTDRDYLRGVARDSWRLFEQYVNGETHHLPPDNVQTVPHTMVANRTSPTNIGLYLLSVACARRFGWIDTAEMLTRCEQTLATLAYLPRERGHFLNWYDTSSLAVLTPAYVSTVDSGNLCGHLVAVAGACGDIARDCADAAERERLATLAFSCHRLAMEPDFGFLFDRRRRLFHIGYRVVEQQLDTSFYDLFASESRLASLWAIAKGDVPVNHWAALGRPFYAVAADAGLRSWSGSMFEYLMPSLVLDEPRGSALGSACCAAIHEQMAYARARRVPWGISESAYAASDHTLAYQYSPQGVPRLALRRTPLDELVVAPYATALAAMFDPTASADNLRCLEEFGARDKMGFVEAIDFTPDRQTDGSTYVLVSTFMAHHQGMTIVALANALFDGTPRRWAMHDARLSAVASLLHERIPREVSRLLEPPPGTLHTDVHAHTQPSPIEIAPDDSAVQPTQLLSNSRYSVALRSNGAGWSRFGRVDVSRWRDDALRDGYGTFFHLRRNGRPPVSITQHPAPDDAATYRATFHADRVHFDAQWSDLRTRCTVWVSPEDDVELRRVELWNTSVEPIQLELMSLFEVSLTDTRADETHPVFANLFVTADWDSKEHALYFARTPRVEHEESVHAVHFIALSDEGITGVRAQTDRALWLGRNREASGPLAYFGISGNTEGTRATGLDPVAALSMPLLIPAHGSVHVTFGTAAAATREMLGVLVDRYQQALVIERAALMSATLTAIRMREMGFHSEELLAIQIVTSMVTLLLSRPQSDASVAQFDRRAMWRFGISGDRPLIVAEAGTVQGIGLVRALVRALRLWSWGGVACDLVVIDSEPSSYQKPLQRELSALRDQYLRDVGAAAPERTCTLHLLPIGDISADERAALTAFARLRFFADGRALSQHVQDLVDWHDDALARRRTQDAVTPALPAWDAAGRAPRGEFDADGRFRFTVSGANRPARPWINVLANAAFGAQISEAGAGYTWAGNSRLHQLTPWSNDPVADPSGETFWLQDAKTDESWNIAAGSGAANVEYAIEHRQGQTVIRHRYRDVDVTATWCVDVALPIKHVRISLRNTGTRPRRLRIVGVFDWVMGAERSDRQSVRTSFERLVTSGESTARLDVLLATQCDANAGFGGSTAFVAMRHDGASGSALEDWTCDRRELFDTGGRRAIPDVLGKRAGAGLDPCAAAATMFTLEAGQAREYVFILGHGTSVTDARALARTAIANSALEREQSSGAQWNTLLDTITVRTPDPLFDVLVNRWLLYQVLACRLWGRAGFYQAGGAFGFRDQLQDTMAVAVTAPQLLRQQLLLSASRQFVEGDVQHWWHPPAGAGVRTRFSDDLLWLPYAAVHYVEVTGDIGILDETVPFLEGEQIPDGAEDAYFVPRVSELRATLYEHCARTLDRSLAVGAHGLPLMGSGDWNDGLNRVGYPGRGESVWLGWFLCVIVGTFGPIARRRNDIERADRWETAAHGWRDALRSNAWDGEWFVRAFFDDGTPLGSRTSDECRIDLVAQSWAVLSDVATPEQQQSAMAATARLLIDEANGLVRMLDPPLTRAKPDPGYIGAYPPGVRENGGQYSHAGVWTLMAQAALGDADAAYRTFTRLSPAHRSAHPQQGPRYQVEPYVMAGDVYTHPPYTGRGGWSWYTGSAAWMHRAAIESICGLRVRCSRISLAPRLPSHWPRIQMTLRREGRVHELIVCAPWAKAEIETAAANGAVRLQEDEWLELAEAGDASRHLIVTRAVAHAEPVAQIE